MPNAAPETSQDITRRMATRQYAADEATTGFDSSWGRTKIVSKLAERHAAARAALKALDGQTAEFQRTERRRIVADIDRARRDASVALTRHLDQQAKGARGLLSELPVADVQRAMLREVRVQRMIATAMAEDQRMGVRIVNGVPVTDAAVRALVAPAQASYAGATDIEAYIDALALAAAADDLVGTSDSALVREAIAESVDERIPSRKAARDTLRSVELEQMAWYRDTNAQQSRTLVAAAEAARAIGDDAGYLMRQAASMSRSAKTNALAIVGMGEQSGMPETGL
jgi:hypothetical protein